MKGSPEVCETVKHPTRGKVAGGKLRGENETMAGKMLRE
jgi:hypothetical protein